VLLSGRNTDMTSGVLLVAAGALRSPDGRFLLHQRPEGKHHAGLWEYPGGKVEPLETPVKALIRELSEELGISIEPNDCLPFGFAEERDEGRSRPIVILLYKVAEWKGQPTALEGGAVEWFTPDRIGDLDKPPLDEVLTAQLLTGA
jgi:8-oxo-dGTP diphosphatase